MTTGNPVRRTWGEAGTAAALLARHPAELHTLHTLARLPLVPVPALQQLSGLRDGASLYRRLRRLQDMALAASIRPPLLPGHGPSLWYLTDLGLATLALQQQVEPASLARRHRLRGRDLLALLPQLPQLLASYDLLAAVAASHPGVPELLFWERPWRQRFQRPTAKEPVTVTVPAAAVLGWENQRASILLFPDLGSTPLRSYRPTLGHLLALRGLQSEPFPTLLVATTDEWRARRWREVLAEVVQARSDVQLQAAVLTWSTLLANEAAPIQQVMGARRTSAPVAAHILDPLQPRQSASPIPRLVGNPESFRAPFPQGSQQIEPAAVSLTAGDQTLLDLVARHPFLSLEQLTNMLDRSARSLQRRRDHLIRQGLLRELRIDEVGESTSRLGLVEATVAGLTLVAAHQGLSLATAVRFNGLAGGGPEHSVGTRRTLITNLAHTRGVDQIFVDLIVAARTRTDNDRDEALVAWHNAAAACHGAVRPDGYGLYRRGTSFFGFFLEYDRGTMSAAGYHRKFAAYYKFLVTRRFERDYEGFPTILVVTPDERTEERVTLVARAAAVGRATPLPMLLTCSSRLDAARNRQGLLGAIWRTPDALRNERRPLLLARDSTHRIREGSVNGSAPVKNSMHQ